MYIAPPLPQISSLYNTPNVAATDIPAPVPNPFFQADNDTFETQYVQQQVPNPPTVSKSQLDICGIALIVSSFFREALDWHKFSIKTEIASLPKHL